MKRISLGPSQALVLLACSLAGDCQSEIAGRVQCGPMGGAAALGVGQILARLWSRNLVRNLGLRMWALERGPEVDAALDQAYAKVWGSSEH